MPSIVSSSTSSNPVKTWNGYQDPGKSVVEDDRSGKPDRPSPAGYSKEDSCQSWSSQEWKSEAAAHDRSEKPETTSWDMMQQICPHREEPLLDKKAHFVRYGEIIHDGSGQLDSANSQEEAESETFVMGSDAAEFVNKAKRSSAKKTEKNVERYRFQRRAFNDSVHVHGCDDEFGDIHGKEFRGDSKFHHEFQRSHFEAHVRHHIEEASEPKRDEINNLNKIQWEKNSWKQLSLIGDERIINLQRTKVCVFSDSVLCRGKMNENAQSNMTWEDRLTWFKSSPNTELWAELKVSQIEFEWNIFPGFTTLQLSHKSRRAFNNMVNVHGYSV